MVKPGWRITRLAVRVSGAVERRRVVRRPILGMLMVSIDFSDVSFA